MSRHISATSTKLLARNIPLDSFRTHCKADCRWIRNQGYVLRAVTAVFNGLESGPFLGYIVKVGQSNYLGISVSRTDRYTRLSHKSVRAVADWLLTGKEVQ
jgi:hypothetical protein